MSARPAQAPIAICSPSRKYETTSDMTGAIYAIFASMAEGALCKAVHHSTYPAAFTRMPTHKAPTRRKTGQTLSC